MLVQDFLQNSAEKFPNKTALICDDNRLTYAEIETRANQIAHALLAHGVERGDRVAIYLPNCAEAVIAVFGILKAGAIFVAINPTTKRDKLLYMLNDCRVTALFTTTRNTKLVTEITTIEVPSLQFAILSGPRAAQAAETLDKLHAFDDLCRSIRT